MTPKSVKRTPKMPQKEILKAKRQALKALKFLRGECILEAHADMIDDAICTVERVFSFDKKHGIKERTFGSISQI